MGKGTVVGNLFAKLGLDSAEYDAGLDKADKDAQTFGKRLKSTMSGTATHVSAAAAGMKAALFGIGFAGAATAVRDAADAIAQIGDEAKRAGLSLQAFQEWKYVAEQNRVGLDAMIDGFKELQLRADEFIVTGGGSAAEAFQRLGYGATELKEKLKDPSGLMLEIIDRLQSLDKAAQIRIFDELLGGSGGEQFVQLLDQGSGKIRDTIKEAHRLGVVLEDEVIRNAAEVRKEFDAIARTLTTTVQSAIVSLVRGTATWLDMLKPTAEQSIKTLQTRVGLIDAAVDNARKSSMAFVAIGGEEGINERLRERVTLLEQMDRLQNLAATRITVTPSGPNVPLPPDRPVEEIDRYMEGLAQKAEADQEAMAGRLQALREQLMTEEEAERFSYETRLADLQTYLDAELLTEADYNDLKERAQQDHADKMAEIARKGAEEEARVRSQLVDYAADTLGSLATLAESFGKKGFVAAKAFGIAQAVINTAEGITKALAQGGILGFAGAAAVAAAGAAQIATIARTNPGSSSRPSVSQGAVADTPPAGSGESAGPSQAVYVNLTGDTYSRQSVEDLFRTINEGMRDGYRIVLPS